MSLEDDVRAIRTSAGVRRAPPTLAYRLAGEDAWDAARRLFPSRLYLRDAQARETLLLDEAGRPLADVLVCADDEDLLLLVDGIDADAFEAHVAAHTGQLADAALSPLTDTHEVIAVDGPWAWELTAAVLGSDLVALPYLNFFRIDEGFALRAGRTGEFGFELLVRRELADEVHARLLAEGAAFGAREVRPEAHAHCRFEAWFFDPRHTPGDATPLDLSLRWRLDLGREGWLGREALVEARARGGERRYACLVAEGPVEAGANVRLAGDIVGEVARAERSVSCGVWLVGARVDEAVAHGGVGGLTIGDEHVGARIVAPPLIHNRSLAIDPRRHSFREADELAFEDLARGLESAPDWARAPAAGDAT